MTIKNKCTVIYEVAYSFSKGGAGSAACQVFNLLSKQGFTVKKIEAKGYQKEETLLEKSKYIFWGTAHFLEYIFIRILFNDCNIKQSLNSLSSPRLKKQLNLDKKSAIFHFQWVGNNTLSIYDFHSIPDYSVITLHDEWWILGASHYGRNNGFIPCSRNGFLSYFRTGVDDYIRKVKISGIQKVNNLIIVSPSLWLMNRAEESKVFMGHKLVHIPNAIDTEIFCPIVSNEKNNHIRQEYGISEDAFVLCFGSDNALTNPIKGHDFVYEVLDQLSLNKYNFSKIEIISFGGDSRVEKYGKFTIYHLGRINDQSSLAKVYGISNLLLTFAKSEAFGLVAAEAMSCGTPVMGFSNTGIQDFVVDEITGILLNDANPQVAAEKISLLYQFDHRKYLSIRAKCREAIVKNFSINKVSNQYKELFTQLCLKK